MIYILVVVGMITDIIKMSSKTEDRYKDFLL